MSYYDGLVPSYNFTLRIERSDRVLIDTTVGVQGKADEIERAKNTLKSLMDEYAPSVTTPPTEPKPAPETASSAASVAKTATVHASAPITATATSAPKTVTVNASAQVGVRGLIQMECPECGAMFGTFLKERQTEISCRCGHVIDLTANLATYRFTCAHCGKETWGKTNTEEPDILVKCKCGRETNLRWNQTEKEYRG